MRWTSEVFEFETDNMNAFGMWLQDALNSMQVIRIISNASRS